MAQTTARPTVVVVDSIRRLKSFTCPEASACIEKLNKIKKVGAAFGTDAPIGQEVISQFYDYKDFMDASAFYDEASKPLPRPPERAHVGPDGTVSNRVKWQYHYLQTFWGSGTHYIVLENHHDAPDLASLGPFGFVCANGQGIMFDRLKTRIQSGEPLVMLHNTGGVVQAFCSLRKAMLSQVPVPDSSELLEKLELVSPQAWAKDFGLPEILMMKELHQRAPMLLRNTCMQVDLLEDGSEKVLSVLTCCFAGGGGVPELGLGPAEGLCVLTAWKRHMTLAYNADNFEAQADRSQLSLYALAVITTVLAQLYSMENAAADIAALTPAPAIEEDSSGSGEDADPSAQGGPLPNLTELGYTMLMLPIGMALINTARSRLRPREKWATCRMAAMQIVDQIYKYRLRTDKYDTQAAPPPLPDGTIPEISVKQRETDARRVFVETCSEIYSNAISTEVSKGGSLKMGKASKLQTQKEDGRLEVSSAHAHIVTRYLTRADPCSLMPPRLCSLSASCGRTLLLSCTQLSRIAQLEHSPRPSRRKRRVRPRARPKLPSRSKVVWQASWAS